MKTLLLKIKANNQGNQNEGQASDTFADFKICHILIEIIKAIGFNSLLGD